jgi:hypothetical protein
MLTFDSFMNSKQPIFYYFFRLIDLFTDGSEIWDNVIIVCKQSMNPDDDSRGPLRVAMEYNHNANVQVRFSSKRSND